MSPTQMPGETPLLQFQVASWAGQDGVEFSDRLFAALECAVKEAVSYRGKTLSLEEGSLYTGQATGVTVHKLRTVSRDEVILPQKTLDLLDRNVIRFVRHRQSLAKVGQTTKKGLLFYGPPGNGKTHTIHYLTGALKGHTTLLITADQMGMLSEYMTLARLLQPSVVVIEDVDLIARERTQMDSPCQESLLNRLLNEMDGLKEEAEILFILTTNRPAQLEQALSARPGRIDQAIEFPVPDDESRRKLACLYSRGISIPDGVLASVVAKTEKTSAAFIKELMRRSVVYHLDRTGETVIELEDVECALEELLVSGGSLNRMLLGADANRESCPSQTEPIGQGECRGDRLGNVAQGPGLV
jgi:AAA+ superfamily predicted ATPase